MSAFQVAFNATTKVIIVQIQGTVLPAGSVNLGNFHHDDVEDLRGPEHSHTLFQHVRDLLYHVGEFDTQLIKITLDNPLRAPVVFQTDGSINITKGPTGSVLTATDAEGTGTFVRRRWLWGGVSYGSGKTMIANRPGNWTLETIRQNAAGYESSAYSRSAIIEVRDAGSIPNTGDGNGGGTTPGTGGGGTTPVDPTPTNPGTVPVNAVTYDGKNATYQDKYFTYGV